MLKIALRHSRSQLQICNAYAGCITAADLTFVIERQMAAQYQTFIQDVLVSPPEKIMPPCQQP